MVGDKKKLKKKLKPFKNLKALKCPLSNFFLKKYHSG
jgi:hypothetical protein